MIPLLINNQKVQCPSSWYEVSVKSAIKLKGKTNLSDIFTALTGYDVPEGNENIIAQTIFPHIAFVSDQIDFDKLPIPNKIGEHIVFKNIGHGTFGQKIQAQKIIHNAFKDKPKEVDALSFLVELLSVYIKTDIEKLIFIEAYPVFNHYCNEIVRLVGRDKKYLESKPDAELTLAGVEKLSKHSERICVDSLAGGDLTKYDSILAMEYDVIFGKLWMEKDRDDLGDRLRKIRERKYKQKHAA